MVLAEQAFLALNESKDGIGNLAEAEADADDVPPLDQDHPPLHVQNHSKQSTPGSHSRSLRNSFDGKGVVMGHENLREAVVAMHKVRVRCSRGEGGGAGGASNKRRERDKRSRFK